MKELSIEEKAKAYDEAIKRAKALYDNDQPISGSNVIINNIFPELKESDDEGIRKALIEHFKWNAQQILNDFDNKEVLAWLEKQGEQKPADKVKPKFHEKDWSIDDYLWQITAKEQLDVLYTKIKEAGYEWDAEKKELKKIKHESIDKVESKFKTGEWVVTSYGKVNQVIAVDEDGDGFTLDDDTYFSGSWKDNYHLWTIADAKNGDVLAVEPIEGYPNPFIAIYKERGLDFFNSYCFIGFDGNFYKGDVGHSIENIHPATKEQCNTLMKAMADAGWEFDFEKKELKKIENETEIPFGAKDSKLQEATYFIPKGFHAEIDDDKVVIKKGEKPTAWSENDELKRSTLIHVVKKLQGSAIFEGLLPEELIAWLKSLKQRIKL